MKSQNFKGEQGKVTEEALKMDAGRIKQQLYPTFGEGGGSDKGFDLTSIQKAYFFK